MKATGIVRRIDDLGRVVVPKEIRRTLRIREGERIRIRSDEQVRLRDISLKKLVSFFLCKKEENIDFWEK